MPKQKKHPKKLDDKKQIAQAIKRKLTLFITTLLAVLLVLIFRIGETYWLGWIIQHRKPIIGMLLFIILCTILASPVIIEANSNPRALSGPGKNPRSPLG